MLKKVKITVQIFQKPPRYARQNIFSSSFVLSDAQKVQISFNIFQKPFSEINFIGGFCSQMLKNCRFKFNHFKNRLATLDKIYFSMLLPLQTLEKGHIMAQIFFNLLASLGKA